MECRPSRHAVRFVLIETWINPRRTAAYPLPGTLYGLISFSPDLKIGFEAADESSAMEVPAGTGTLVVFDPRRFGDTWRRTRADVIEFALTLCLPTHDVNWAGCAIGLRIHFNTARMG